MLVLAIDSSLSSCSAALWREGVVLAARFELMERGQSEALMPMIAAVMDEAEASFAALDLVGVTVGPGTFTGLRIGLAAARAIGLARRIAVAGVSTLQALASAVPASERHGRTLRAVVDSKREDVFVQDFDAFLHPLAPPRIVLPDRVFADNCSATVAVGNGMNRIETLPRHVIVSSAPPFPHAATLAPLAASLHGDGTALPALPLYLRAAETGSARRPVALPACPIPACPAPT